jgi:hypothetical protein
MSRENVEIVRRDHAGGTIARNIGPVNMFGEQMHAYAFGHYDPSTGTLSFWEHSLSLPDVFTACDRLLPIAETAARKCLERGAREMQAS